MEEEGALFTRFDNAFFIVNPIFKYLDEGKIVPYEDNKSFLGEVQSNYLNYRDDNMTIGMMEHIFGKYNYIKYGSYYLVNADSEDKLDKIYDGILESSVGQTPIKLAFHFITKIKGNYDNYPDYTDEKFNMKLIIDRAINRDYVDEIQNSEERMKRYSKLFYQQAGKRSSTKRSSTKQSKSKQRKTKQRKTKQRKSKQRKTKQRKL